jgi:radical SAM superfamily enzyme
MSQTSGDMLKLDMMENCICGNGLEVMFVCLEKSCPDYESHPYFCMKCSSKKHKSHLLLIINQVEELHEKWTNLRKDILSKFPEVQETYEALEQLIEYIENAIFQPNVIITKKVNRISQKF